MGVESLARTLASIINKNQSLKQMQSRKLIMTGVYMNGMVQVNGASYKPNLAIDIDLREGCLVRVAFDPMGRCVVIGQ